MGTKGHNKRRNSGLLYEFLVRRISRALVENDKPAQANALKVLKRHFKLGSELLREQRLVSSLVRTTVSSPSVAASIIIEAKASSRTLDHARLEQEKSELLRHIAKAFKDDGFFETQVGDYRAYATVQTLVNEWREPRDVDFERLARYEDELARMLVSERKVIDDRLLNGESPGTNRLIAHTMTRRLNEKYAHTLDPKQRELVRTYVFSTASGDDKALRKRVSDIRDSIVESLEQLESEKKRTDDGASTVEKIQALRAKLISEKFDRVDDEQITRILLCLRLRAEIDGTAKNLVEGVSGGHDEALNEDAPRLLISSPEFIVQPTTEMVVTEARQVSDGNTVLRGILQKADTLNQNGRIYPKAILEREVRNYQKFINERRALGELDHPDSSVINLKNTSHLVIEARMDGNTVMGSVEILKTPSGSILDNLNDSRVKLGISSRGVGSTRKQGDYVVVQEDFQLICWDFVSEPSTPGAFMLPEGRRIPEGRPLNRFERVDRLVSELLVG